MSCVSCGSVLKPKAKFCGNCGAKVQAGDIKEGGLHLAESPLGLNQCEVRITEVTGEGPDSDGDVRLEIKYELTNNTKEDWDYFVVRAQVLDSRGLVVDETRDTNEQTVSAGESGEFECQFGSIKLKTLGENPEKANVLLNVTACTVSFQKLGEFEVPMTAFEVTPLKPVKVGNVLQIISGSLWKTEPDSDKDSSLKVNALVQNLTAKHLHEVKLIADITDKAGREVTDAGGSEEIKPGEVGLIAGSGYSKDKQLKGAKVTVSLRVYCSAATGISQHCGIGIQESDSTEQEEDNAEERRDGDLESENIEDLTHGFPCNVSLEDGNAAVCVFLNVVEEETEEIIFDVNDKLKAKLPSTIRGLVENGKLSGIKVNGGKTSIMVVWILPLDREKLLKALDIDFGAWRLALEESFDRPNVEFSAVESSGDSRGISSSVQCYGANREIQELPDCLEGQEYEYDDAGSTVIGYESTGATPFQACIITYDGTLYKTSIWDSEADADLTIWIKQEIFVGK